MGVQKETMGNRVLDAGKGQGGGSFPSIFRFLFSSFCLTQGVSCEACIEWSLAKVVSPTAIYLVNESHIKSHLFWLFNCTCKMSMNETQTER